MIQNTGSSGREWEMEKTTLLVDPCGRRSGGRRAGDLGHSPTLCSGCGRETLKPQQSEGRDHYQEHQLC